MVRSYVVTFAFVLGRLAMQFPLFSSLGLAGVTATIWVSWIMLALVTEIVLQWQGTAQLSG
jgi:hypothetical protein